MDDKLKEQFAKRCEGFDISANWISSKELICAHADLAGKPNGKALDLCCGTGQIGRLLKESGWDVRGLDICEEMVNVSGKYFPTLQGKAERLPFNSNFFNLVVCRQAFQFLNAQEVLSEVARVLKPQGVFILSLTVPFSNQDQDWLYEIHRIKQPLLLKFYTEDGLSEELKKAGFLIQEVKKLKVRESIVSWMKHAPELSSQVREEVITAVKNAPPIYKKLHNVKIIGNEVLEDWNWVILKTSFLKS